jgi:hypothetical protein
MPILRAIPLIAIYLARQRVPLLRDHVIHTIKIVQYYSVLLGTSYMIIWPSYASLGYIKSVM